MHERMKLTLLILALLASSAALPSVAAAESKDTSITVDVDLTETSPKKDDQVLTFTLSLAEHGCATAETSDATVGYEVKVCREANDLLSFEVSREERSKDTTKHRKVRVSSKVTAGKRIIVAKIARGDTDATEVAATLK